MTTDVHFLRPFFQNFETLDVYDFLTGKIFNNPFYAEDFVVQSDKLRSIKKFLKTLGFLILKKCNKKKVKIIFFTLLQHLLDHSQLNLCFRKKHINKCSCKKRMTTTQKTNNKPYNNKPCKCSCKESC